MPSFSYHPPYPLGPDETPYRLLTREGVSTGTFEGQRIVKVAPDALTELARIGYTQLPPRPEGTR
jgi:fumarate hydratase class I